MDFRDTQSVIFRWFEGQDKIKKNGRQMEAWNAPVSGEMLLELFFDTHGFVKDNDNQFESTYLSIKGYTKDGIICILESETFEDSSNNIFKVICGR